jgi:flagellar biosynthesis chaperone FliJ
MYEDFLSAKDRKLLLEVEQNFIKLNDLKKNIDNLTNEEISNFLSGMLELDENARDAIKESLVNVRLPQTQLDSFYNMFMTYTNNISDLKNGWDSIENSRMSVNSTYDSQISTLENQIQTTKTNIENLETNKLSSVDT